MPLQSHVAGLSSTLDKDSAMMSYPGSELCSESCRVCQFYSRSVMLFPVSDSTSLENTSIELSDFEKGVFLTEVKCRQEHK